MPMERVLMIKSGIFDEQNGSVERSGSIDEPPLKKARGSAVRRD